jgi:hypothetical protein
MDFHQLTTKNSAEELVAVQHEAHQTTVWTALPGIIESFDPIAMTVKVQPATKGTLRAADGTVKVLQIPTLPDVPVVFPRGGGFVMTFPIAKGDECLLVFSSRSIDDWWQQGGVQTPNDTRMHDINDGFAVMGAFSQPNVVPGGVSTNSAQMRSIDNSLVVDLNSETGIITMTAPMSVNINAPILNAQKIIATGDVIAGTISEQQHTHRSGSAGSQTSTPIG